MKYHSTATIIIPAKIDWFPNQLKVNPSWRCQFFSTVKTVTTFTVVEFDSKKFENVYIVFTEKRKNISFF